jgi:hypothetical protein
MTRQEQLELIRQKCIEANPDKLAEHDHKKLPCQEVCTNRVDIYHDWNEREGGGCTYGVQLGPIRLADVLLAIGGRNVKSYYSVHKDGHWCISNFRDLCWWNLRKDDLTEQSDECIAFLADLLN